MFAQMNANLRVKRTVFRTSGIYVKLPCSGDITDACWRPSTFTIKELSTGQYAVFLVDSFDRSRSGSSVFDAKWTMDAHQSDGILSWSNGQAVYQFMLRSFSVSKYLSLIRAFAGGLRLAHEQLQALEGLLSAHLEGEPSDVQPGQDIEDGVDIQEEVLMNVDGGALY
ncbi:uncharacterized protein C8Q71DRAFT_721041 [Rhodofomes roseus]|uniref:Uncharacterized protein n=1 Tax=Rhodofomes roseus TaxID=34475 RepID=A0A4Y9XWJ9_9APHY|nr:uncharacterized protein C8Q71DRAFT_721041 [Rhodofomes roseus]KAH9842014.1 hypothetical protein C8Q71DRAFT_721041 [Rhodofomes roseus]TFY54172.1 hypothetical protein EVJ58_g9018 [Rhodofomes roseus]